MNCTLEEQEDVVKGKGNFSVLWIAFFLAAAQRKV